jgi:hypothetical protein
MLHVSLIPYRCHSGLQYNLARKSKCLGWRRRRANIPYTLGGSASPCGPTHILHSRYPPLAPGPPSERHRTFTGRSVMLNAHRHLVTVLNFTFHFLRSQAWRLPPQGFRATTAEHQHPDVINIISFVTSRRHSGFVGHSHSSRLSHSISSHGLRLAVATF